MSAANDTVILCRFCGHINAAGAGAPAGGRCAGCGAFSGLEAVAEAEARQRSRRTRLGFLRSRLFRASVVVVPLLAALFWLLWEYTGLPPDPPLPSTNIGSTTAATPAGDWPQARGGVAGAAATAGAGGGIGVDAAPAKVWEYMAGAPIVAPPAVVGDRIYLTAEDGRVVALARDTGAELWRYDAGQPAAVTPAVSDGLVFVVFKPGVVSALDAATGAVVWSRRLAVASLPSPRVADGRLFVAETDRGRLLALDAATGETLWDYRLDDWVIAPPALADGKAIVTANDAKVQILDAATGRLRMYYDAGRGRWARGAALAAGGQLHFSSSGGRVWGIDYRGHRYPLERAIIYIRTVLWVWGFTQQGPEQQGYVWSTQTAGEQPYPPALAGGDTLVVADAGGIVTGLDAAGGSVRWERDVEADIPFGATIAGPVALVGAERGRVMALSAADGTPRWEVVLDGAVTAAPIAAGGLLLAATDAGGGALVALAAPETPARSGN